MEYRIKDRIIKEAKFMLENKSTVRETSKIFGVSKSTVHYDISNKLKEIDFGLYEDIKKLLEYNKSIRHVRGGNSTKSKYQLQRRE